MCTARPQSGRSISRLSELTASNCRSSRRLVSCGMPELPQPQRPGPARVVEQQVCSELSGFAIQEHAILYLYVSHSCWTTIDVTRRGFGCDAGSAVLDGEVEASGVLDGSVVEAGVVENATEGPQRDGAGGPEGCRCRPGKRKAEEEGSAADGGKPRKRWRQRSARPGQSQRFMLGHSSMQEAKCYKVALSSMPSSTMLPSNLRIALCLAARRKN